MSVGNVACALFMSVTLLVPAGGGAWAWAADGDGLATTPDPASEPADPTTKPTVFPKKPGRAVRPGATKRPLRAAGKVPAAISEAIQELCREFQTGKLRTSPDYFQNSPSAEMTTDLAVALLNRRLGSSDAMDGYIKWQLVAVLPKELSAGMQTELLAAYRAAPMPPLRPGLSADQKRILDRMIRKPDRKSADVVAEQLANEVARVQAANVPLSSYRDALLERLPENIDTVQASLLDLYQRASAGMDVGDKSGQILDRVRRWAENCDQRPQLEKALSMLKEFRNVSLPSYYQDYGWNQDNARFEWTAIKPDVNRDRALDKTIARIDSRLSGNQQTLDKVNEQKVAEPIAPRTRE